MKPKVWHTRRQSCHILFDTGVPPRCVRYGRCQVNSEHPRVCLFICQCTHAGVCVSVCLCACASVRLCVCMSMCLYVYVFERFPTCFPERFPAASDHLHYPSDEWIFTYSHTPKIPMERGVGGFWRKTMILYNFQVLKRS